MAEKVGSLLIELSAGVAKLQTDMSQANRVVQNAANNMVKSWKTFQAVVGVTISGAFAKSVIEAGAKAEQSANRLTAAYRLQSAQIGLTREDLDKLADSLAAATQFDDNDFKRGEAELLKFGNIYGDVFTRALALSADLAAFNGTDLVSATDALGKALANPADGVKGLGAAIGKLSAEEREHIKTLVEQNKGLEAQTFILNRVSQTVGGTAQQMNTGYTKAIEDAAKAWDKFKEALAGVSLIKDSVVSSLEAIAGALRGLASVFSGGSFSEGMLGKQTAMAKEITDLRDQIAVAENRKGLTFTDDEGRVIGEELRTDDLKKKLQELEAEYKRLFQTQSAAPKSKQAAPNFGLTPDQIAFMKSIREQIAAVGEGPIGSLFARAAELHLGEKTRGMIQQLGQSIKAEADEADRAAEHMRNWAQAHALMLDRKDAIADLKVQTQLLGANAEELAILTATQRMNNEERQISRNLAGQERYAFVKLASTVQTDYIVALRAAIAEGRKWQTGIKQGMSDVMDAVQDQASLTRDLVVNAFHGMEDALVQFVKTGKLNFRDMADSIISDLIRIQIRQNIIGPLASGINLLPFFGAQSAGAAGSSFASAGSVPALASGTDFVPKDMFAFLHKGEQVVPKEFSGNGGGTNVTVVQNINVGAGVNAQQLYAAMKMSRESAKADIMRSMQRNGAFARAVR